MSHPEHNDAVRHEHPDSHEHKERLKRYGRHILTLGRKKPSLQARNPSKLSTQDRERIARKLGLYIERLKVDRPSLMKTKAMTAAGISPQELYRLVIPPHQTTFRQDRLRADIRHYQAIILGLAELTKMDPEILAHRIATGTSIHPVTMLNEDGLQQIIHRLYAISDKLDEKFGLSERFTMLSARKRSLTQQDALACWPNGECFHSQSGEADPFQFHYWRMHDGESELWDDELIVENTSLHQFVRYLPHILLGIDHNFDGDWPIANKDAKDGSKTGLLGWPSLKNHRDVDAIKQANRQRLRNRVDDPSVQRLSWDDGHLMINGLREEDYLARQPQQMTDYLETVGVEPDWERDRGALACEHAIWLCLYPSWQTDGGRITNLIPVIAINYGGEGWNGEIVVTEAENALSPGVVSQRLLGDKTLLERLEELCLIAEEGALPEVISEFERTALFIENHPLMKRYRQLETGMQYIEDWVGDCLGNTD
ncbi:hypothetical protein U5801_19140 [Lamprobacter modestohalophilus]|uniref:hypothetical protein n=1 Tax=Lamprobacter modestohalophilus TaxID=1064514 RepID=UPI002ADEAF93|nr:hypothetical protein [Lamprobacter modestohalophilus]MEA1051905.1 hypothetical protein [Lamprobacter modestohalophilus]